MLKSQTLLLIIPTIKHHRHNIIINLKVIITAIIMIAKTNIDLIYIGYNIIIIFPKKKIWKIILYLGHELYDEVPIIIVFEPTMLILLSITFGTHDSFRTNAYIIIIIVRELYF